MPMRAIAKKRCRAMFEPPEKGERATLNSNLSTRLNLLFSDQALGADGLLLVEEGERAALNFRRQDFEIVQQDQVRDPSPTNRVVSIRCRMFSVMSASPSNSDIARFSRHLAFVPKADIWLHR